MKKNKKQNAKLVIFVGFLLFLFAGAFFMYTTFNQHKKPVEPTTVPYRTKQNPYYVDSLIKAGYYDTFHQK
jgi:flagellar basal body-associated protein FliL